MKTLPGGWDLTQNPTTLATIWLITRQDGVQVAGTDFHENLTVGSIEYKSADGYERTSITSRDGGAADQGEISGIFNSVSEADIRSGLFDGAEIQISIVDYLDIPSGTLLIKKGWLGEITITENGYSAEHRGLADALRAKPNNLFGPICRADFGDARCGISLGAHTTNTTVTTVTDAKNFHAAALAGQAVNHWKYGVVEWTTISGGVIKIEVESSDAAGNIRLLLSPPATLLVGDSFSIRRGCSGTIGECKGYSNILNRRAEDHIPGEKFISFPDVKANK